MRAPAVSALGALAAAGVALAVLACPARARDLEKAGAPPTLEACPAKGPGFVRLPGSRTCTRLSGRASAGIDLRAGSGGPAAGPTAAGRFAIDTRTDSDLGEVRTYVRIGNGHH